MKLKKLTAVVASMLVVAMNAPTLVFADEANKRAQVKYFTPEVLFAAEEAAGDDNGQNSATEETQAEEIIDEVTVEAPIVDVIIGDSEEPSVIPEGTDITETEVIPEETILEGNTDITTDVTEPTESEEVPAITETEIAEVPEETSEVEAVDVDETEVTESEAIVSEPEVVPEVTPEAVPEVAPEVEAAPVVTPEVAPSVTEENAIITNSNTNNKNDTSVNEPVVVEEEITIVAVDSKNKADVQVSDSPVQVDNTKTDVTDSEVNNNPVINDENDGLGSIDIFADIDSGLDIDDVVDVTDTIVDGAVGDSILDDSTIDIPTVAPVEKPVTGGAISGTTSSDNSVTKPSTGTATDTAIDNPLTNGAVNSGSTNNKVLFYESDLLDPVVKDDVVDGSVEGVIDDAVDKVVDSDKTDDKVIDDSLIGDDVIDTGIATETIVDNNVAVPGTDKTVLKGAAGFVSRIYTIALDRDYEQAGLDYWVGELKENGADGFDIFKRITDCPEFTNRNLTDSEYLEVLYKTFFDRDPDGAGFDFWKDKLMNDPEYTREHVLACFVDSVEWANICAIYGILSGSETEPSILVISVGCKTFVERLYATCLSREPDQAGLDYWCSEIASLNYTGKFAAYSFINSPEFNELCKDMTSEDLVTTFYKIFFDREPEEEGMAYWVNELPNGEPAAILFNGFSDSPEFAQICEENGIDAGPSIIMDTAIKYDPAFEKFMSAYGGYGMGILDEASLNLQPKLTYKYANVQGEEREDLEYAIPEADIAAIEKFSREHFNAGWTPQMKIAYTFYWIHENMLYAYSGNVAPTYCVAAFERRFGQCAQYNGALVEMLCYLGYDAALIRGTRGSSAPGSQHFWGELYLNGETYVIEVGNADSDGNWNYFFVPYEFTRKFIKCGVVMGQ